jgi:hypothetical protein
VKISMCIILRFFADLTLKDGHIQIDLVFDLRIILELWFLVNLDLDRVAVSFIMKMYT